MQVTVTAAMVFQVAGGVIMAIAIGLFIFKKAEGTNVIRFLGVEVEVSAPSLLMLVLGVALFSFPYTPWFHEPSEPGPTPTPAATPTVNSADTGTMADVNSATSDELMPKSSDSLDGTAGGSSQNASAGQPGAASAAPGGAGDSGGTGSNGQAQAATDIASTAFPGLPAPADRSDWTIRIQGCTGSMPVAQQLYRIVRPYGFHTEKVSVNNRDKLDGINVVYAIDQDRTFGETLAHVLSAKSHLDVQSFELNIAEGQQNVVYVLVGPGGQCPGGQ